jgi:hypothetical protein
MKCLLGSNLSVQQNTVGLNSAHSLRNEMQLGVLNEVVQKKMVAEVWKFIAACYHITQRYTVHTKQLVTHKQSNRTGKISFPIIAGTSIHAFGTNSL